MKIKYRFAFGWSSSREARLKSLGLEVKPVLPGQEGSVAISHVDEGAPGWDDACQLVRSWNGSIFTSTEFSAKEIAAADFCVMRGVNTHGYPQPETNFDYMKETYSSDEHCRSCGTGLFQVAPFRIKRSVKMGRSSFMQLHWVVGEFFMSTAAWRAHLMPLGVPGLGVRDTKGQSIEEIVQLVTTKRAEFNMDGIAGVACPVCGRERYMAHDRGYFPCSDAFPDLPAFRSEQYFGAGGVAFNEVVVRADVVRKIQSEKMRGVSLWPCASLR